MKIIGRLFTIYILVFVGSAAAETGYIDDAIPIWSHTGPTAGYKVKYQLSPGTQLEILQTNEETGFVEVKDELGRTSWLPGKFITKQPTVHQKLSIAEASLESIKATHEKQTRDLNQRINQLAPMEGANQELQKQLAKVQNELEQARQKAQMYETGFNTDVFFGGAAVLLGGMFFGWLTTKLGGKKRGSGWN